MRQFAIGIACALAGCAGGKSTPAPAEDPVAVANEGKPPAAPSDSPRSPVVTIDGDRLLLDGAELVTIDALPDALAKRTDASATNLELVLRAEKDAPALLINAVLEAASAAGYTTIALCPRTGDRNETCPRLVLSDRVRRR